MARIDELSFRMLRITLGSDAGARSVRVSGAKREAGKEEMKYTVPGNSFRE